MLHANLLDNDNILPSSAPCLTPGQVGVLAGWGVFSTLRIASGVLFEYPRHFARMQRDACLLRIPFPQHQDWMESRLLELVEANRVIDGTLRVVVVRNTGSIWQGPGVERPFDLIAFTTKLTKWGEGVRLGVVPQARHAASRYAGTKVLSWAFNLNWYEEAHERGFDEVVLLNEREEVCECTSANLFAAFGNDVWTPPLSSGCLPGITRELLLQEIKVPGLTMVEKAFGLEQLQQADEVFITSSTRDVLPVLEIEGLKIQQSRRICAALKNTFTDYIAQYVANHAKVGLASG